jgi:hypothetical protein
MTDAGLKPLKAIRRHKGVREAVKAAKKAQEQPE